MAWNYRVMKHINEDTAGKKFTWMAVHETYYNDDGSVDSWSNDPIAPYVMPYECLEDEDTTEDYIKEMKEEIYKFLEATLKPVLSYEDGKEIEDD